MEVSRPERTWQFFAQNLGARQKTVFTFVQFSFPTADVL
jgi:hypothetical protein